MKDTQNREFAIDRKKILDDLMNYKGFQKKVELSDFLEIKPNVLSNWFTRNTFDENVIMQKFPDINRVWLLTGEGNMLKEDDSISPKEVAKQVKRFDPKVSYESGRPFYDVDFTLGFEGVDNDITLNPEFNIDFPPANRDSVNWYRGKGNSMLGEINSGDYIALEEVEDFTWFPLGRIYGVVTKNGFRTIKRIVKSNDKNEYLLVSSNPDKLNHPDQPLPKNMIFKLYKVVFVIKDLDE